MKVLLFLFSIIFLTNAQVPTCPHGSIQFYPSENVTTGTDYPLNSNLYNPPLFPDNFNCDFKINVPQGLFAIVQLTFSIGNPGNGTFPVIVTNHFQISEGFYSAKREPFYFLANGGSISLTTGMTNTNFGFTIDWTKLPSTFTPNSINVYKSSTQPQVVDHLKSRFFFATAETKVSVLIVHSLKSDDIGLLRGIMIYDGPDWNPTLLGTAYQLWKSNTQWVSTGKQMTIQYLADSFNTGDVHLIFQDYESTKHIVHYQSFFCSSQQCQVSLENSNGPSALITYTKGSHAIVKGFILSSIISSAKRYNAQTITRLDGNGTMDVYIGGVTSSKKNLISSYQVGDSTMFLPQAFPGSIITYVLNGDNSKATIDLDCNGLYTYGNRDRPIERQGFISSNHYMKSYTGQYVAKEIYAPEGTLATFSFVVRSADITKNTDFMVIVTNKGTVVYNEEYNISNLPLLNQSIKAIGDRLTVLFDTKKDHSKGLYMDFGLSEGSSNFCVFVSTLIMSLNIYFS